ncbi:MAG: pyridoxamine 5'-phosphate oxidase family protein [Candidatus Bathyarchaeota archaeon]|nr:pyridoxamine 5'-phosphate oxidase family protein [Candidatus Bathyarchaeota archaeon]MDH5787326.1 pyridoxamine 5'-phosphate oxidase family protein [Candidatus Bathyarchaeota archaeon]
MNENEAKHFSLQLMETAWAVYVTTIDEEGLPNTRAMDNLRSKERFPKLVNLFKTHEDDLWILLSTNTSSAKIEQIEKNPAVSAYYCEPRKFHGVMLNGMIEIAKDSELKKAVWHDYWTKFYPKGVDDPDYTLLSLHPTRAKGWHGEGSFSFTLKAQK